MYITLADLDIPGEILAQITDDEGSGGVNEDRVNAAINDAQALVDGYCGKRYKVPFAAPTALVKRLTATAAKYNLYSRRDLVPESLDTRYKATVKTLEDISKGVVSLGIEPEPTPAAETGGTISGPTRVFDRDKMKGF